MSVLFSRIGNRYRPHFARYVIGSCISSNSMSSTTMPPGPIGFIGLGNMGMPMAENIAKAGYPLVCHDADEASAERLASLFPEAVTVASSPRRVAESIASEDGVVITVLPNDRVLKSVTLGTDDDGNGMLPHLPPGSTHVSCSTISPDTSRELSELHRRASTHYVAAPIFARPDGMAAMQAHFVVSGDDDGAQVDAARSILRRVSAGVHDFGRDPGAANVVKLCGNFLIGSAIESMAEALALAEDHGLDRGEVMDFYGSTFLDSVIYRGYGQRVSERDHREGGFALVHGLKDLSLARDAAHGSKTPMPFLSVLVDRYLSEAAKGREDLDWSAIGLGVSEDSGVDVQQSLEWNRQSSSAPNPALVKRGMKRTEGGE